MSFALLLAILPLAAPAAGEQPSVRTLTPPNPDAATPVDIDVYDLQVFSIQEQEEVFHVGGRLDLHWFDPRQAYDADAVGTWRLEYQGQSAIDKLDSDVWWPDLEFVDAVDSRDRMSVNLTIDSDGEIWYRERFNVQIKQDFYLGDFPYDEHTISFALEPFTYRSSAIRFVHEADDNDTAHWEPTEWVVGAPDIQVDNDVSHVCLDAQASGDAEEEPLPGDCTAADACPAGTECQAQYGFPRVTVAMDISRVSSSYTGNIIFPLVLIVIIVTAVFWMDLERTHLGDRLAVSFTGLLTVVAFDFVTSDSLPKLWYSTALDRIVTASYVFLTLNIALSVLIDHLDLRGGDTSRRARRLNAWFRWLFPVAYLATVGILMLRAT